MAVEVSIDLQTSTSAGELPGEEQFSAWVGAALAAAGVEGRYELALRIVDEDESRALNRAWRDKDTPTNVLSFPFDTLAGLPADVVQPLGDIVMCGPVVLREAAEQGKKSGDHWAHMVVHGSLHLLGLDHETDEQAETMETLEAEILQIFGIGNPYGRGR